METIYLNIMMFIFIYVMHKNFLTQKTVLYNN